MFRWQYPTDNYCSGKNNDNKKRKKLIKLNKTFHIHVNCLWRLKFCTFVAAVAIRPKCCVQCTLITWLLFCINTSIHKLSSTIVTFVGNAVCDAVRLLLYFRLSLCHSSITLQRSSFWAKIAYETNERWVHMRAFNYKYIWMKWGIRLWRLNVFIV